MSIIRYTDLSLKELLGKSSLVLEVSWLHSYQEEVPIITPDKNLPDSIPPFIKRGNVFTVKRILKNEEKISVPETIQVPNENWRRFFSQHKAQYLDAPNKSFGVEQYQSSLASIEQAGILFLRNTNTTYELAAAKAFEDRNKIGEVIELISK